jgi:hypothetical protein
MGLQNATIAVGATVTATGGTTLTWSTDAVPVNKGIHLIDASITDFKVRPSLTVTVKQPVISADRLNYSKDRKTATLVKPKLLASGKVEFPLARLELEIHPDMSVTEIDELRKQAAQILTDSDFDAFWRIGSLA